MSGSRASKGCIQCRTRKVKCDEQRPSCNRCIQRGELCTGWRDGNLYLFRDENERVASLVSRKQLRRHASAQSLSAKRTSSTAPSLFPGSDESELSSAESSGLTLPTPYPWMKEVPKPQIPSTESQAISQFFEKFVMHPCNSGSSPGFLELLPCLFEEVQTQGRMALRWSVRAVSYASLSHEQGNDLVRHKANLCYGRALLALGETLRDKEKAVSDYTLMTVVILDIFESIYLSDPVAQGSHTEGMAQILRLRGPNQLYSARGWSLFRLAHHRLQKQQLAFSIAPPNFPEQDTLISSLNEDLPVNHIESDNFRINKICQRARELRARIMDPALASSSVENTKETIAMIREMHALDIEASTWRVGPSWQYQTIPRSSLPLPPAEVKKWPEYIELHKDIWIAYEWNYHRTARIILHTHLLECIERLLTGRPSAPVEYFPSDAWSVSEVGSGSMPTVQELHALQHTSTKAISQLIDSALATVPQSLADIDAEGIILPSHHPLKASTPASPPDPNAPPTPAAAASKLRSIGAYFLLWPIKVLKGHIHSSPAQQAFGKEVFERIREMTGVKRALGDKSCI